jgi:hypothetical protein
MHNHPAVRVAIALFCSVAVAASLSAQQQAGGNTTANSAEVIAAERAIWESIVARDWTKFDHSIGGMTYVTPQGIVIWRPGNPSQFEGLVMRSYSWDSLDTRVLAPGIIVISYKATIDETENGKKGPSPVYMLSVWQKKSGRWTAVAHSETPGTNSNK